MVNELNDLINQCHKDIELSKAVNQLKVMPSFNLVLNDLNNKINNLVLQLSKLTKDSIEYDRVIRELDSISYFNNYLTTVIEIGDEATLKIKEAKSLISDEV